MKILKKLKKIDLGNKVSNLIFAAFITAPIILFMVALFGVITIIPLILFIIVPSIIKIIIVAALYLYCVIQAVK